MKNNIYFGSVDNKVYLAPLTESHYRKFSASHFQNHFDAHTVAMALSSCFPLKSLGEDYSLLVQPCVSAIDLSEVEVPS
jgi:hypothetical protein